MYSQEDHLLVVRTKVHSGLVDQQDRLSHLIDATIGRNLKKKSFIDGVSMSERGPFAQSMAGDWRMSSKVSSSLLALFIFVAPNSSTRPSSR